MTVLRYEEIAAEKIRECAERRLGCTDNLMMVIIDFNDGPQDEPDPPHSHPHEQMCYVAAGEIYFLMEGQKEKLKAGDMFLVPSGVPHSIQLLTKSTRLVDCFTPIREDFLS